MKEELYRSKVVTVEQALSRIKSNDIVGVGLMGNEPQTLLRNLHTIADRVENVTGYGNMDRRVFDTWTRPGDHSPYRQVMMLETPTTLGGFTSTKPTSRFVQRNNELYVSSLSIGYDFYRQGWLRKVGLQRLKLDFYVDELVRLTNIQVERGTSYPFARTFSFSVNATF